MTDCATLSVPEAARVLGIGRIAMYRAVKEGRVAVLRVGRRPKLRIPKVAIQELLRHPDRWETGGEQ